MRVASSFAVGAGLAPAMPTTMHQEYRLVIDEPGWPEKMPTWHISHHNVIDVRGEPFVYLTPYCNSLINVVCFENTNAPTPIAKNFTLTNCIGLRTLISARNAETWKTAGDALFAGRIDPDAKRPRRSKGNAVKSDVITITIPAFNAHDPREVKVKTPTHPCDKCAVSVDVGVLMHVLAYLRSTEFDDASRPKSSPAKGVWSNTQRGGYLVKYFDHLKGRHRTKSLADETGSVEFAMSSAQHLTDAIEDCAAVVASNDDSDVD